MKSDRTIAPSGGFSITLRVAAIESSSRPGSVALFEDEHLVAQDVTAGLSLAPRGELLMPVIAALFERAGWAPRDVARWAVGVGPGSFTGARIGVALAKGIALVTGAELVGVTSLDAVAYGLPPDELIVSLIAAGKGELFVQAKRGDRFVLAPSHLRASSVTERLLALAPDGPVIVAGQLASEVDWSAFGSRVMLKVDPPHDRPCATAVGRVALTRAPCTPEDADALEPVYVRPPEITVPIRGPRAP